MVNARKATVPLFMAAILGAALVLSILAVQHASAASDNDDNKTMTMTMTMTTNPSSMMKGQIASVQMGTDGQPGWIQSGMWLVRVLSSDPQHPSAQLVAKFEMVKPDGTAAHPHSVYNFNATEMTQEGNSTKVLKGTATVTMKDGPVDNVPLTVKIFNNAVVGIWIGPDKVDSHFGTGPIFGTLSAGSKASAMSMMATGGEMKGTDRDSSAASNNQTNATGSNATTTTAASIKMSAQEVDETYRWSTSDGGVNPTLKMTANADNTVQIANPTDTKHELVIESNGKELTSSGDIAPDSSGQLAFKPLAAGTYEYHCEYHPDTMKGTIEVAAAGSS